MPQHAMCMRMAMRHLRVPLKPMLMLMMLIQHMPMPMLRCLMQMLMGMPLRQVQPHAHGHQRRGNPEGRGHRFAKYQQRHCSTEKGKRGRIYVFYGPHSVVFYR